MNLHLAEIATQVAPGAIAALLLDQAGWHMSSKLVVPANIVIVPLPPKCPEFNPTENVWQFMRDNWRPEESFVEMLRIAFGGGRTIDSIDHPVVARLRGL